MDKVRSSVSEIFYIFLMLGLRSFGGPVAHLGYFHSEFVLKRGWLSEKEFADLTALCQFLPGPASSQTGFGIGYKLGGLMGAFSAWLGFTLPSALLMTAAAYGLGAYGALKGSFVISGLMMLTVAVVAQAVWSMGRKLCTDTGLRMIAVVSAFAVLVFKGAGVSVAVIILSGISGFFIYRGGFLDGSDEPSKVPIPRRTFILLAVFVMMFILLPFASRLTGGDSLRLFDIFFRAGALVFGGGHVVLPLLQAETVGTFITDEAFLSGYGIAQLMPGPLFTFSAYIGAAYGGVLYGAVCLAGIFMSTFLLVPAVLPVWDSISEKRWAASALKGINACVVGILLAALYNPVAVKGVHSAYDFAVCLGAFALLVFMKLPVWFTALFCILFAFFGSL